MRNQIARVTLGAFFCLASATAQGSTSSSGVGIQLGAAPSIAAEQVAAEQVAAEQVAAERVAAEQIAAEQRREQSPRPLLGNPSMTPTYGMQPVATPPRGGIASGSTRSYLDRLNRRARQDDTYSLTRLFRQNHGEFLDRHERFDPELELGVAILPNQRVGDEPGDFNLYQYDFDIEAPVIITTEAYLLFGLYQYGRHYSTSTAFGSANNQPGDINHEGSWGDETLTAAGVRLGLGWFLNENLLLEVQTNPGVYSDLEATLGHKDYDFPSSALFSYRSLDNFFFKFGVRYNQIYADAPWLPYLGFSWDLSESLRIDLLAPEYFEISYWPEASTSFAFGAEVSGAQYRVHSTLFTGKQEANAQVQEVVAYLGATHRFSDQVSLQLRGGIVLAGEYDLTTGAESATSPFNRFDPAEGALDQGFYADITFGLSW
jgi:hypothetical protein